jgi:hypothetical protein
MRFALPSPVRGYLIGAGNNMRRNCKAKNFGLLEFDDQFHLVD